MEKPQITKAQIAELANKIGIEPVVLQTVINIESSGRGFDATGRIKIQFEPKYFLRQTGKDIPNEVGNQNTEWEAFDAAFKINPIAAKLSSSWGMGQIMGENFKEAGFYSVDDMVKAFAISEYNQVLGMVNFIASNKTLLIAIRTKNWPVFAERYNGPNFRKYGYDLKLPHEYQFLIDSKY